jgi:hypothetical protein
MGMDVVLVIEYIYIFPVSLPHEHDVLVGAASQFENMFSLTGSLRLGIGSGNIQKSVHRSNMDFMLMRGCNCLGKDLGVRLCEVAKEA